MILPLETRQQYIRLLNPQQPLLPDDPRYVPLDEGTPVRGLRSESCVDSLFETILLSEGGESRQLFSGFPGTGKTTELRRLEARLRDAKDLPTYPIYIDFEQYIDRFTPISIMDVLRVLAYCLDREAMVAEGKDPDKHPGYLQRLFEFISQSDVELQKLGFASFGASLMMEFKNNRSFQQRIADNLQLSFQHFADQARDVMTKAVIRLKKARGTEFAQRIVVLADSLEKLQPLREEDREKVEASAETVFYQHADLLRLPCHVIYTFPLWLRFRTPGLGGRYDREAMILPMIKVFSREDGRPYEVGIGKLKEMLSRRMDLAQVFGGAPESTLDPLVLASGGYFRDLLRMSRELLYRVRDYPVKPSDVERVIADLSDEYRQALRASDLDLLAAVAASKDAIFGDQEQVQGFGRLLERWLVLAYRNGSPWFDVHPLVRRLPQVRAYLEASAAATLLPAPLAALPASAGGGASGLPEHR